MSFCQEKIGIDPTVLGYQILVLAPVIPEHSEGGVYIPSTVIKEQQRRQNIGLVLKIGPSAFTDRCQDRKCEEGQWIAYSNFERSPEYVGEHVLYYLSDAHVLAIYSQEDVDKILRVRK